MKKQIKQKNKFRQVLSKMKKPLMIFSIILNIIFALALVIGLSSKPKAQSVSAEDSRVTTLVNTTWYFKDNGVYPMNATGSNYTINLNYSVTSTSEYYGVNTVNSLTSIGSAVGFSNKIYMTFRCSENTLSAPMYLRSTDTFLLYDVRGFEGDGWYVRLPATNYYLLEPCSNVTMNFTGGSQATNVSVINYISSIASQTPIEPDNPIPDDEEPTYIDVINLGDNFNPVTYVTQNGDYILNGFAGLHSSSTTGFLDLTGLTFESNGQIFNRIRFILMPLPAHAPVVTLDGVTYIETSNDYTDYICCSGVYYQYVEDNNVSLSIQVISYRRTIINDNGVNINAYDVRQPYIIWLNNEYRVLNIISDDESIQSSEFLTISGMTTKQLLQVTSSVNTNVMGLTDVFGLLKGAFAGISGILAISILPGITLGLLLFIPLIVTIIIAVVRLIKK